MSATAVGIIHARGGSRRVPLKNLRALGGKPLVAWIIEAARRSQSLSRIIVSTDHDEIARVAREYGADVPFRRPAALAEDVPSELVTMHAMSFLESSGGRAEVAVTLQPTTPFVRAEHIDACIDQVLAGADSAMTVAAVRERPEWMLKVGADGRAVPYAGRWWVGDEGVSQELPPLYMPNGGVFATRRDLLMEQRTLVGGRARAVIMPLLESIDIDEEIDFAVAEAALAQLRLDTGADGY